MATAGYAGRHRERAEAQQRAAVAGRRRRSSGAALTTHLAQQPGSFDGRKIAAVDKNIDTLDVLPDRYASVKVGHAFREAAVLPCSLLSGCRRLTAQLSMAAMPAVSSRAELTPPAHTARCPPAQTLYLSKNSLRSLAGVEQFRELRALSAADNLLADLDCLAPLATAGLTLEAASFEGNPMADLPNYRAHVIHTLGPTLAVLDNRWVLSTWPSSCWAALEGGQRSSNRRPLPLSLWRQRGCCAPGLQAGHSGGACRGGGRRGARGHHAGPHALQRLPGAQAGPRGAAGAAAP